MHLADRQWLAGGPEVVHHRAFEFAETSQLGHIRSSPGAVKIKRTPGYYRASYPICVPQLRFAPLVFPAVVGPAPKPQASAEYPVRNVTALT